MMDLGLLAPQTDSRLDEFQALLKKHPLLVIVSASVVGLVAVKATANRHRLIVDRHWPGENWDTYCAASDLFWTRDEIFEWAATHPCRETGIHYMNVHCATADADCPALAVADMCGNGGNDDDKNI